MSDQSIFSYIIKNRLEQNNVDKYYTSNKEINNAAKKVLSNKIFSLSTGNLKIDLWKDKNLDLYAAKKKIIKKKFKNFIIFNSDIRYLHNKNDFEDNFDLDVYKSLKKDSRFIKKEMSNLKRFSKFKNKNFLFLIKLLNNIDKNLKKIKLIIRPHPTEDINIWRIVTKNLKNIEISPPTDDVIPYILASKGVIHNGCTTSNASICLNKPTGYLIDNSNKYNKDYIVKNKLKYCFKISNSQDFIYWLNNLNKYKPLNDKNKRNFFKKMNIQKESVSDLVIKDLSNSQIFKEKKIYIPKENMNYFSEFLFKMKSIIKKTLYMKKKRFYISKIPSAITHLEANKYIKILDKNDKRKEKTLIRQVKNNLIEIECS
jgi:surface carbohydrate biosynthesis protein